jgi:hypothetical protein
LATQSAFVRGIKGDLNMESAFPLSSLKDPKKKFGLRHKFGSAIPQIKEAEEAAEYLNCSLDDLYFIASSFYPYAYYKDFVYIDMMSLDKVMMEYIQVKDRIVASHAEVEELMENKDFHSLFVLLIDKRISFSSYKQLYDRIPDEQKYDVFMDIYTLNEYGFSTLGTEFVEGLFPHRTPELIADVQKRLEPHVIDGRVTIYRGEGSESTPYSKAFSWTLNLSTAMFFASRYNKGKVYKTVVDKAVIFDFIEDRGEAEVIVSPRSMREVVEVKFKTTKMIMDDMKKSGHLSRFNMYNQRLKPELFHNPDGIHAVGHCARVLFHVMNLSRVLEIGLQEERMLATAALYHDIGRVHDDEDEFHGLEGYKKMLSLGLGKMDDPDSQEVLKYIIDNHCLDDHTALANVDNYTVKDKERSMYLLQVFKDADGLDRVRLRDLDVSYLRNNEAMQFEALANDLLKIMA